MEQNSDSDESELGELGEYHATRLKLRLQLSKWENNFHAANGRAPVYEDKKVDRVFQSLRSQLRATELAWNTAKIEVLNNPKVQRAIVLTGWSERWEQWLSEHELNAARAFGVKVTMRGMRSAVSGIASIFALVMYFLLRSELQSFTA